MATSEGIPSSIDIEFLELNDNPYCTLQRVNFLNQFRNSLRHCLECDIVHNFLDFDVSCCHVLWLFFIPMVIS